MPSLRDCLGLIGKGIHSGDAEAIHARSKAYQADGHLVEKAEKMAVDWHIGEANRTLADIRKQAAANTPTEPGIHPKQAAMQRGEHAGMYGPFDPKTQVFDRNGYPIPRYGYHAPPASVEGQKSGFKAYRTREEGAQRAIDQRFGEKGTRAIWLHAEGGAKKPREGALRVDLAKLDPENLSHTGQAEGNIWHRGDIPEHAIERPKPEPEKPTKATSETAKKMAAQAQAVKVPPAPKPVEAPKVELKPEPKPEPKAEAPKPVEPAPKPKAENGDSLKGPALADRAKELGIKMSASKEALVRSGNETVNQALRNEVARAEAGDVQHAKPEEKPDEGGKVMDKIHGILDRLTRPLSLGSTSPVDKATPAEHTFRDAQPGEVSEGHGQGAAYLERGVNAGRTAGGERPITLSVQTLSGGQGMGSEGRGHPDGGGRDPRELARTHRALELALGKKIIFVKPSERVNWDAITSKSRPDLIAINTDAKNPFAALVGHEFGHDLNSTHPELYKAFRGVVEQVFPMPDSYRKAKLRQGYNTDDVIHEWTNDKLGSTFTDPKMWDSVAAKLDPSQRPGFFKGIADAITKYIAKIATKLKGALGMADSGKFQADLDTLREAASTAIAKYQKEAGLVPEAKGEGQVEFSKDGKRKTDTPEFKKWFGESKVLDKKGEPLVMYHGTDKADFNVFKTGSGYEYGPGAYFADEASRAERYAGVDSVMRHVNEGSSTGAIDDAIRRQGDDKPGIYPVYLALKNPIDARAFDYLLGGEGTNNEKNAEARRLGYDGVVKKWGDGSIVEAVAFNPEQVKSATGNRGTFDPTNPDIRYSKPEKGPERNEDAYSRSLAHIHEAIPPEERFVGKKAPGEPVKPPSGKDWHQLDLNKPIGDLGFTQPKVDSTFEDAVKKSGPAAARALEVLRSEGTPMKPPSAEHWNDVGKLPLKDRLWYELGSESMARSFPDNKGQDLAVIPDMIAATSPQADPNYNAKLTVSILAEMEQGKPIHTPAVNEKGVSDVALGKGASGEARKVGSFGNTFKFLQGIHDEPPLSTNDRQVASSYGIPDSAFGRFPVLYELVSRHLIEMRNDYNGRNAGNFGEAGPMQSHQLQAPSWVQTRADKRLASGRGISNEKAFDGDAYGQALKQVAEELRAEGVDVPQDAHGNPLFTKDVLRNPKVTSILTPTADEFRNSVKLTQEVGTNATETGKKFNQAVDESKKLGVTRNLDTARQITDRHLSALGERTASRDPNVAKKTPSPLSRLAAAFSGGKVDISRIEKGWATYAGDFSRNLRASIDSVPEKFREAYLAVTGKMLRQAASAASQFIYSDSPTPAEGTTRTYSAFVSGLTEPNATVETFVKHLASLGYDTNVSSRPNGLVIDINPKFGEKGPEGIDQQIAQNLTTHTFGPDARLAAADHRSYYVESGDYSAKIAEAKKEILNEHAAKIADAFGSGKAGLRAAKDFLRGEAPSSADEIGSANERARAERERARYAERLHGLDEASNAIGQVAKAYDKDMREAMPDLQARLARARAKAEPVQHDIAASKPGSDIQMSKPVSAEESGRLTADEHVERAIDDGLKAGRSQEHISALAVARYKAINPDATPKDLAAVAAKVKAAYQPQPEPKTPQAIAERKAAQVMSSPAAEKARTGIIGKWNDFKNWKSIRDVLSYTRDAGETQAGNTAGEMRSTVEHELNRAGLPAEGRYLKDWSSIKGALRAKVDLASDALGWHREAGDGGVERLQEMRDQIEGSEKASPEWKARALKGIDYAIDHYDKLTPASELYREAMDQQLEQEQAAGKPTIERQNYVPHSQDMDESSWLFGSTSGMSPTGSSNRMVRTHATHADSIAAGVDPKTLNAIDLMHNRIKNGQSGINATLWQDSLHNFKDEKSGLPLATKPKRVERADGSVYFEPPKGYRMETLGNVPVAVHESYAGIIEALTDPSWLQKNPAMHTVLKANALGKSLSLLVDTFHLGRMAYRQSAMKMASLSDFHLPIPTYNEGRQLLDNSPAELAKMAGQGELDRAALPELLRKKANTDLMVQHGLQTGHVADNLHQEIVRKTPVLGDINKFIFEKFQRGAMTEAANMEFDRQTKMYPEMSREQVARKVAKEVNTLFGNLGRQGILKSRTAQDAARLMFLAPQWNEGLIRREIGAVGQMTGAVKDAVVNRRIAMGALGREMIANSVSIFIANQFINQMTRGKYTWENPEEGAGAKLSAWIPDKVGQNSSGFFLNPLGISAEISHFFLKDYERTQGDKWDVAKDFLRSRASVGARPFVTWGTGENSLGQKIRPEDMTWEVAKSVAPVPIGGASLAAAARGLVNHGNTEEFPGQFQKQLMASAGVKTDMAPSAEQRIMSLAKEFNHAKGIKASAEFYATDYDDANKALRRNNPEDIQKEMGLLLQKKSRQDIEKHYRSVSNHPFTGRRERESEFIRDLKPEQRTTYLKAKQDRIAVGQRAINALRTMPQPVPQP